MDKNPDAFVVLESSGVGTPLKIVCVYKAEEKAIRHIELAKILMPHSHNKITYQPHFFQDEELP